MSSLAFGGSFSINLLDASRHVFPNLRPVWAMSCCWNVGSKCCSADTLHMLRWFVYHWLHYEFCCAEAMNNLRKRVVRFEDPSMAVKKNEFLQPSTTSASLVSPRFNTFVIACNLAVFQVGKSTGRLNVVWFSRKSWLQAKEVWGRLSAVFLRLASTSATRRSFHGHRIACICGSCWNESCS